MRCENISTGRLDYYVENSGAVFIDLRSRLVFLYEFYGLTPGTTGYESAKWLNRRVGAKDDEHFIANVKVIVSNQFISWIFSLGDGVKIVGPEDILEKVKSVDLVNFF